MVRFFLVSFFSLMSTVAFASNQVMTYQGVLTNSSDEPYTTSQTVTFSIYSPAPATCLLYSEEQTIVPDSKGRFTAKIGSGTRNDGLPHPFLKAFMNGGALTGLSCANGDSSYTPGTADKRVLSIKVNGTPLNPPVDINSVPYAMQAQEVSGWGINNLVKVHPSTGSPTTFTLAEMGKVKLLGAAATCAANEILKWDGSAWICSPDASGGAAPGDASYNSSNKGLVAFDTDAATSGISVASGIAKLSNTAVAAGSYGSATEVSSFTVDAQGRLTAASSIPIALLPSQIAQSGANNGEVLKWNGTAWVPSPDATGGAPSDSSYGAKGVVQFDTDASTSGISIASGVARVHTGTGANQILRLDGSGKLPAVDGSALANLNIGNASTGTLQVNRGGTGVTAFNANALVMTNGTGTALGTITCSPGQILKWNGSTWGCDSDSTGVTNDGSFAAKGLLQGLTDAETSGLNIASGVISVNAGTSANQILKLDGSGKLPAVDGSALLNVSANSFSGVLTVAQGGTNSSTALNNDRLMVSSGGRIVEAAAMTNGQIVVGSTGAAPAVATLGSSNGISITTGAGSLSIATNATPNNTASTIVSRDASGNFAAGAVTNTSNILKGSTSGTLTMTVPASVTPYTLTWPSGVGSAGAFLTTDAAGNLSWGSPAAISDATYTAKGAVQFDTDAATSGLNLVSGIASVNTGTGPKQIVQMDASSKLPAVDGSALTNLNPSNLSTRVPIAKGGTGQNTAPAAFNALSPLTAKGDLLTKDGANHIALPLGTNGQVLSVDTAETSGLKWIAPPTGSVTGVTAGTGLLVGTTVGATISTTGTLNINVGTAANQIVQLDGTSRLPAVDGSLLANLNAGSISSGVLPISRGGTNSGTALNNNRLMMSSSGAVVEAPAMTNGQIVVGSTGAAPAVATLGSSNGISITTGAGSLSIATNATPNNTASTIVSRDASGNFAAGAGSFSSAVLRGSTSGTLTVSVPATVTDYTIKFPAAVGAAGTFLTTDAAGNLSWGSPAAIADASYAGKGAVQFLTNASTSGITVTSGVASVNAGTGANQIVKLNGSSQLPAVDGSLLTNLSAANIASGVLPIARGGTNNGSLGITAGGILYMDGSKAMTTAAGTAGKALVSGGAGAPTFGTLGISGGGTGLAAIGANGTFLSSNGTVAAWSTLADAGAFVNGGNTVGVGTDAVLGTNSNNTLVFETNANPRMKISGAGNVGVGVDPNADDRLFVKGNSRFNGEVIVDNDTTGSANGASRFIITEQTVNLGDGPPELLLASNNQYGYSQSGDRLGHINFSGAKSPSGTPWRDSAKITADAAETFTDTNWGGNLRFHTAATGGSPTLTERMIITAGGNIGIGTSGTATSILDINGALTTRGIAQPLNAPTGQGRIYFDSTANKFKVSQHGGNYVDLVPAATGDATYAAKGLVQGLTNAATSGLNIASGVISVNAGTGANQIVKLNASAQLPAMDGSLLTNLNVGNLASGVLPIARGGTNNGSLGVTAGGILYMDGSKTMTTAAGTSGQALISAGAGAPAFGTLGVVGGGTGLTSGISGGIPYFSTTTTMGSSAVLPANGVVLGGGAGAAPTATAAGSASQVLRVPAGGGTPSFGTAMIAGGGTGTTSFASNALIISNGTGSALTHITCNPGEILKWNTTAWICAAEANGPPLANYGTPGLINVLTDADYSGLSVLNGNLKVNDGTGANQIVKMDSSGKLPIVDGSNLTNLSASQVTNGILPISRGGTNSGTALSNGKVMISSGGQIIESAYGFGTANTANTFVVRDSGNKIYATQGIFTAVTSPGIYGSTGAGGDLGILSTTDSANPGTITMNAYGGNVVIGSSNALNSTNTLDVNKLGSTVLAVTSFSTNTSNSAQIQLRKAANASEGHGDAASGHVLGKIDFQSSAGGIWQSGSQIQAVATGAKGLDGPPTNMSFWTADTNGESTNRMTLESNGRLGIGTSTPAFKLHVVESISDNSPLRIQNARPTGYSAIDILGSDNNTTPKASIGYGNPSNTAAGVLQGKAYMGSGPGTDLLIRSNDDEIIRIPASNGHVGIKQTNPQATLDVNGFMRLKVYASAPVTCSTATDGAMALTSKYWTCVCKGTTSTWVRTTDGATACVW